MRGDGGAAARANDATERQRRAGLAAVRHLSNLYLIGYVAQHAQRSGGYTAHELRESVTAPNPYTATDRAVVLAYLDAVDAAWEGVL